MEGFLIFISIIFGVLSLILFFKIWGLCNDIKQLKNHYLIQNEDLDTEFEFFVKIGEIEKAKRILYKQIFSSNYFSNQEWKSSSKITKSLKDFKDKLNQVGINVE